jgi:RHS repeat-associated protein
MFIGQTLQQGFVPLPGKAQAEYFSWGLSHYRHPDWLGSIRLESTTSHAIVSAAAYAPFGEPYAQSGSYGELSFTGANKDTLWLDYDFLYREDDPKQGRWISPDPAGLAAVDPTNPQSWNRYAYVLNNPLRNIDPTGTECMWDDGSYDSNDDPQSGSASSCGLLGGTWIDHIYFLVNGMPDWSGDPGAVLANNSVTSQCLADYNNSPAAKGVKFFSLYNLATNVKNAWPDWTVIPAIKITAAKIVDTVSQAIGNTEFWNVTTFPAEGPVVIAPTAAGIDAAETAGTALVGPTIFYATGLDILAHAGCDTVGRQAAGQMTPLPPGWASSF